MFCPSLNLTSTQNLCHVNIPTALVWSVWWFYELIRRLTDLRSQWNVCLPWCRLSPSSKHTWLVARTYLIVQTYETMRSRWCAIEPVTEYQNISLNKSINSTKTSTNQTHSCTRTTSLKLKWCQEQQQSQWFSTNRCKLGTMYRRFRHMFLLHRKQLFLFNTMFKKACNEQHRFVLTNRRWREEIRTNWIQCKPITRFQSSNKLTQIYTTISLKDCFNLYLWEMCLYHHPLPKEMN